MTAPKRRWGAIGFVVALAVALAIVATSIDLGAKQEIIGLLSMVPFIAALFGGPMVTLAAAALALGAGFGVSAYLGQSLDQAQVVQLTGVGLAGVIATGGAALRIRRTRQMTVLQEVADVSQQTVLRPLPPQLADLLVAVRYRSANSAAQIGGDLYEAVETPFGVRFLVGDVRGKGLAAVTTASAVLGAFRESAHDEPDLAQVAARMDASLRRVADEEEFVTAVLVEVADTKNASVIDCGHHPPLIRSGGGVRVVELSTNGLPLGVGRSWQAATVPFESGDRMLLYTDGIVEARGRRNRPFPILERSRECMTGGSPEQCLDLLIRRLERHVGRRPSDDLALMIVQRAETSSN